MSNLSFVRHKGDGVTNQFALSVAGENIGYFRISDIHGYVDDKEVPITIDPNSPHIVRFTETPKLNVDVLIRRQVPVKKTYADFERGNNFGHRQVNNTFVQQLYLTQELLDGFFPSGFYFKQDVDLGGHKIINLGDATEDTDAVSKKVTDSLNKRLESLENSVSGSSRFLPWTYNAVGGEDTLNPPYQFESARVFINGVRQRAGESFEIVDLTIMLAEPLEEGDWVDVELGTEPKDTTWEKESAQIYSALEETDSKWVLTGKVVEEKANTVDVDTATKYDKFGREYSYNVQLCWVLEDFGYNRKGNSASDNSYIFQKVIDHARGFVVASRSSNCTVLHDSPINILGASSATAIDATKIILPPSLVIKKTSKAVGSVSRTFKPASESSRKYTFNTNCVFNIIPFNDSINYAYYVQIEGGFIVGSNDSTVGVFDAPMCAYCSFTGVHASMTMFYFRGIDCWQLTFENIRSRFSQKHFYCPLGTSWLLNKVACDGGKSGGSDGQGFSLGVSYTTMNSCAVDKCQLSYDFFGNAGITMNSCGSESFGRLIRTRDNANVVVNGGQLEYDCVSSNVGAYAEPWSATGNSSLSMNNTKLLVKNYSTSSDTDAFAKLNKPLVTDTATLTCVDCVHPSEVTTSPKFDGDELSVSKKALGKWEKSGSAKYFTANSVKVTYLADARFQTKDFDRTIPVDGGWHTLATVDLSSYGSSISCYSLFVDLYDSYVSSVGLVGSLTAKFAGSQQASGGTVVGSLGFDKSRDYVAVDFTPSQPTPSADLQVVTQEKLLLVQLKLTSGGGKLKDTKAKVFMNYTTRIGNDFKKLPIS